MSANGDGGNGVKSSVVLASVEDVMGDETKYVFDDESAKGEIVVRVTSYGLEIDVNGVPVCLVDLYYGANPSEDDWMRRGPQLVLDDPGGGDALGFLHLLEEETVLELDTSGPKVETTRWPGGRKAWLEWAGEEDEDGVV